MSTWFEGFRLDDGREVTVEWSWDATEGASVVASWLEDVGTADVELTDAERERFHEQVISLRPFPPHEPFHEY